MRKNIRKTDTPVVGGGVKKVLYTLATVRKMGVARAAKALTSKNACKACGYGMGGQLGGMTNELGEFPSVCNKSVQAQSSDTQAPIPSEIFDHSIRELQALSGKEIEGLGRLNTPLFKAKGDTHHRLVSWEWALDHAGCRLKTTQPSRSFFYSSGRSSNEAGFVFQLLARAFGTNNVNNCSYYCHQATSEGLGTTIGKGTSTVELNDLTGADLIFVIGANPSSNHPRFIHMLKKCRERGGNVIIINPAKEPGLVKFAVPKSPKSLLVGGSDIASEYIQPRIGGDVALLKGLAKAILELEADNQDFIQKYCDGFVGFASELMAVPWAEIVSQCGVLEEEIMRIAKIYAASKNSVFAWGMGVTHHVHGVENVEAIANLALIRGMVGKQFAGLLPLRGHSNVQGIGTIGVKPVLAEDVLEKIENHFGHVLPRKKGMDTMACLGAAFAGNIDCAIIMGGNLYEATPGTEWAGQALGKIGLKVFLTTTLNRGHVHGLGDDETLILPVTARDEEWEPTTQESMFNYVRLSDGGISRLDNVRPETHILCDLAAGMLTDCEIDFSAFKEHRKTRDAIAKIVPGLEELADIDVAKKEFHIKNRVLHTPKFGGTDGKAVFRITPMPKKPESDKTIGRHNLTLATIRSEGQFNTIIYEEHDSYRKNAERRSVLLNQADMSELNIEEGQIVTLCSDVGTMPNVRALSFDLPAGNALAYYPEANVLVGAQIDPRSKTPAFKSVAIWIEALPTK